MFSGGNGSLGDSYLRNSDANDDDDKCRFQVSQGTRWAACVSCYIN